MVGSDPEDDWLATASSSILDVADITVVARLVLLAKAVTGAEAGVKGGVWISILER
jgi:hypothetical protein